MTISNLRCDVCDAFLPGLISSPGDDRRGGVRFSYHPGDPRMRDDSGVLCGNCWSEWDQWLGKPRPKVCTICGTPVERTASLHLRNLSGLENWRLCNRHAAELLNRLRTVEPKFDPDTFQLPTVRDKEGALDA